MCSNARLTPGHHHLRQNIETARFSHPSAVPLRLTVGDVDAQVPPSLPLEHSAGSLAEWQLGIRGTWAHLLEQARKEWEEQYAALTKVRLTPSVP